ncbi:MAG: YbjN domain-containing protein [Bacilli bacterium]|nr:YbjN domain-containing protein [Bacilli bacterium]
MDEKKQALENMKTLCDYLDEESYRYDKVSDSKISFKLNGDDLQIDVRFSIDEDHSLINLYSSLPFKVPERTRNDVVLAVTAINWHLVDGSFDYEYREGWICFRLTTVYRDSIISKKTFDYMLSISADTVELYNDKLFLVSQGKMSLNEFKEFLEEDD